LSISPFAGSSPVRSSRCSVAASRAMPPPGVAAVGELGVGDERQRQAVDQAREPGAVSDGVEAQRGGDRDRRPHLVRLTVDGEQAAAAIDDRAARRRHALAALTLRVRRRGVERHRRATLARDLARLRHLDVGEPAEEEHGGEAEAAEEHAKARHLFPGHADCGHRARAS
jgi:hypothetical protein